MEEIYWSTIQWDIKICYNDAFSPFLSFPASPQKQGAWRIKNWAFLQMVLGNPPSPFVSLQTLPVPICWHISGWLFFWWGTELALHPVAQVNLFCAHLAMRTQWHPASHIHVALCRWSPPPSCPEFSMLAVPSSPCRPSHADLAVLRCSRPFSRAHLACEFLLLLQIWLTFIQTYKCRCLYLSFWTAGTNVNFQTYIYDLLLQHSFFISYTYFQWNMLIALSLTMINLYVT